jgi:hypothetical protein
MRRSTARWNTQGEATQRKDAHVLQSQQPPVARLLFPRTKSVLDEFGVLVYAEINYVNEAVNAYWFSELYT